MRIPKPVTIVACVALANSTLAVAERSATVRCRMIGGSAMNMRSVVLAFGILAQSSSLAGGQTLAGSAPGSLPNREADIGAWDVAIVRRAAAMIASPAQWNRSDKGSCTPDAKTVSLRCALQRAVDEPAGRAAQQPSTAPRVDCRLTNAN